VKKRKPKPNSYSNSSVRPACVVAAFRRRPPTLYLFPLLYVVQREVRLDLDSFHFRASPESARVL